MSPAEVQEFAEVMGRVKGWAPGLRVALARGILDGLPSLGAAEEARGGSAGGASGKGSPGAARELPRGPSAAEVQRLLKTDRPPPGDETVERWIDEHREEE